MYTETFDRLRWTNLPDKHDLAVGGGRLVSSEACVSLSNQSNLAPDHVHARNVASDQSVVSMSLLRLLRQQQYESDTAKQLTRARCV